MKLIVKDLLNKAREVTGLNDFGEPCYSEGLNRLVDSVNLESSLSTIGKEAIPAIILGNLVNRLKIEDCYRNHPEIEDEVIESPVFITGLPRTGSSALGNMLSLDTDTRMLRGWEAYEPCPPPDAAITDDPRIAANEQRTAAFNALVPGLVEALPRTPNGHAPEECYILLDLTFASVGMNAFFNIPSFERWAMTEDLPEIDAAYQYHRRVLKLLQWKTPAQRWLLRTPLHSTAIRSLLKTYPDARFIWTHRHPHKVIPSICSLIYQLREVNLAEQSPRLLGLSQLQQWSDSIHRLMRDRDIIGDKRFFDLYHSEQIIDPQPGIRDLYQWLGWEFTEQFSNQLAHWQKHNPKGKHRPVANFFDLKTETVNSQFVAYNAKFGNRM